MPELLQLYDKQGRALSGQGATKVDILRDGLLHGASHVWIWRRNSGVVEVLLQKRAPHKRTWPNLYTTSAAGHIDLGEDPIAAAVRETKEEIGLDLGETELRLINVHRDYRETEQGDKENEFQWIYLAELTDDTEFTLQESEVTLVEWRGLQTFATEVRAQSKQYEPRNIIYFETVLFAIESVSKA